MYHVYGMAESGNCYKIKLLLECLQQRYDWTEINILQQEHQCESFLSMNPNGKVPLLVVNNNNFLPESNAALYYLARDTAFFPADKWQQAQTLQWMFFEQYSHEPAIAVARFIKRFLPEDHPRLNELPQLHQKGYQALHVMENHLSSHDWFGGAQCTIADIALFAYTHVANEGGFTLSDLPNIQRWINNVKQLDHFVEMGN